MKISPKIAGENARAYAHRIILDNIINLELPPGSAVSENELSACLQLSRTPIREALIEMSRLKLVEILPQKGSYVTKIDYELIEEARFVRLSLETSVLKLACEQGIDKEYLYRIRENIERNRQCAENEEHHGIAMELDNSFHKLLFESVGKLRAYEFVRTQMVHFDRLRILSYRTLKMEKFSRTINDHENILYALEKRDGELAEMLIARHLTRHQLERAKLEEIYPEYFVL